MKNGHSTFSALEYSKELRAAGFSQEQAELQARQFELIASEISQELATKRDVKELDLKIVNVEKRITDVEKKITDVEKKITESEKEIIKYVGNQNLKLIGVLGVLIALLKFLPDFFN